MKLPEGKWKLWKVDDNDERELVSGSRELQWVLIDMMQLVEHGERVWLEFDPRGT